MLERLFEPIMVGTLNLKNRIIMPAMGNSLAEDGRISKRLVDYYVARARGGASLIITQSALIVDSMGEVKIEIPSIFDDRFIDGLKKLSGPVKKAGAKVGIQLVHMGAQGHPDAKGKLFIGPSPVNTLSSKDIPRELSIAEIQDLVEQFSEAARRAKDAGFDMVEFHGGHGYLISQFLSKYYNRRKDAYGNTYENMARFPCEIIQRTRDKVGNDFTLGIRINGDDFVPGGTKIEDAKGMVPYLVESGIDYLSISGGIIGAKKASVAPMMEPRGYLSSLAKEIKENVNIPVVAVGRINDPVLAERILEKGWADIIAMGRPLIADPNLPVKAKNGDFQNIRKCIACNQGCLDRVAMPTLTGKNTTTDSSIRCLVNPRVGREGSFILKKAEKKKKILVAGGGPAGMEAARIASKRGHEVVLMEKTNRLGGQLYLSSKIPFKEEIKEEIRYLSCQMERHNVKVMMNHEVNLDIIKEFSPDVIIVATGAKPGFLQIDNNEIITATAWDVIDDKVPVGDRVLIVGGASVGFETALFLGRKGKEIILVEQSNSFAADMGLLNRFYMRSKIIDCNVTLMKNTLFKGMADNDVVLDIDGKEKKINMIDTIVWAIGALSNNPFKKNLINMPYEFYVIGDAKKPGNALDAIHEAHKIALQI